MSDFTPWEVHEIAPCFRVVDKRNSIVASLIDDKANARLIAAAPDGYVIAERLVKSVKYWAKHEKYAACPICEGYRISEAAYEHGDLCPAFLAEKYLALVDKETR